MKNKAAIKYHITTFGCQMNKSDSERIASVLECLGYKESKKEETADLVVINSCSVRQSATDRIWGKGRQFKQARELNKNFKAVLTGCVLPQDKKKFEEMFDIILDIKNLPKLPEMLGGGSNFLPEDYLLISQNLNNNFSACVPIMTGCDNFCSYCAVPFTRGREISRSVDDVLSDVKKFVKRGYKEIWLLGQNVNSYKGKVKRKKTKIANKKTDFGGKSHTMNFAGLLRAVNSIKGDFWIRFTSPHPKDFSADLISALAGCEKVTNYVNLPVQSGDNSILRKMNRHYTVEHYLELLSQIRKKNPGIAVSTDVIVGFPQETKKQFENTKKLFKKARFDMAFIAKFSSRPGTAASFLKDNVLPKEKERRWKELTAVLKETALSNNKKLIGTEQIVLVDEIKKNEKTKKIFGKTSGFKNVEIRGDKLKIGEFANVKITGAQNFGLLGKVIK